MHKPLDVRPIDILDTLNAAVLPVINPLHGLVLVGSEDNDDATNMVHALLWSRAFLPLRGGLLATFESPISLALPTIEGPSDLSHKNRICGRTLVRQYSVGADGQYESIAEGLLDSMGFPGKIGHGATDIYLSALDDYSTLDLALMNASDGQAVYSTVPGGSVAAVLQNTLNLVPHTRREAELTALIDNLALIVTHNTELMANGCTSVAQAFLVFDNYVKAALHAASSDVANVLAKAAELAGRNESVISRPCHCADCLIAAVGIPHSAQCLPTT